VRGFLVEDVSLLPACDDTEVPGVGVNLILLWSAFDRRSSSSSICRLPLLRFTNHIQATLINPSIMKLTSLCIIASSFLAVSAFGVSPSRSSTKAIKSSPAKIKTAFTKDAAARSPLFRDASKVRGGAVPGWAAYNDALDKKPLITKAMTSLVGWALGDVLAQVCSAYPRSLYIHLDY
jgi:hypothetical protein